MRSTLLSTSVPWVRPLSLVVRGLACTAVAPNGEAPRLRFKPAATAGIVSLKLSTVTDALLAGSVGLRPLLPKPSWSHSNVTDQWGANAHATPVPTVHPIRVEERSVRRRRRPTYCARSSFRAR
jgi:hypothetical protein